MKTLLSLLLLMPIASSGFAPGVATRLSNQQFAFIKTALKDAASTLDDRKFCIPLEEIRLEDLPKVGGYVMIFLLCSL